MNQFIPLSIPNFEGNEKKYVDEALDLGWVSTGGAFITRLEKDLALFLHTEEVAACQSGTAALHLSLVEAGIRPGDVVLVPPLTFIAAVNPVKYQFATPIFIDCDDSFCMDPVKLRSFCEQECLFDGSVLSWHGKPVRAVVVVHVFGNMEDMVSIMEIAETYHLIVIEDATEALGTCYTEGPFAGRYAGTIGHYYIHDEIGYNYRMTNLQAALGVAQMEELPEFIRRKQRNYELYRREFEGFPYASLMPFREGISSNKWFYSLCIDRDAVSASMRDLITALGEKGIQTRAIWGLINEQKPYEGEETYHLEKAPYYASRILNLPCSTQITEEEILTVCREVKKLLSDLADNNR